MDFKKGQKVRIINDWLPSEAKKKRVQILGFQENGLTFARVRWLGNGIERYEEEHGNLFPLDELRVV